MSSSGAGSNEQVLTTPEEWRAYLAEYGRLFVDSLSTYSVRELDEWQRQAAWFGREPAGEQAVAAAEDRLGITLPPSLRSFLLATDGWTGVGGWVTEVFGCADLKWFREDGTGADLIEIFGEEGEDGEDVMRLFERSLLIAAGEDVWLLDPAEVGPDGEWAAAEYQPKYGELERLRDFSALMAGSRRFMEECITNAGQA